MYYEEGNVGTYSQNYIFISNNLLNTCKDHVKFVTACFRVSICPLIIATFLFLL